MPVPSQVFRPFRRIEDHLRLLDPVALGHLVGDEFVDVDDRVGIFDIAFLPPGQYLLLCRAQRCDLRIQLMGVVDQGTPSRFFALVATLSLGRSWACTTSGS